VSDGEPADRLHGDDATTTVADSHGHAPRVRPPGDEILAAPVDPIRETPVAAAVPADGLSPTSVPLSVPGDPVGAAAGDGAAVVSAGSRGVVTWRVPRMWRVLLGVARLVIMPVARLRVTGDVPADLRSGPIILAVNHIGPFDPIAITAACRVIRLAPRLMATGGLFRAPVVGAAMRAAGHIRINRRQADVALAVDDVAAALAAGSHVLGYPEGRITLDPGMWPERGKTGMARVALATGAPVVAVAQWGAHEVAAWGGFGPTVRALCRALVRRPVVRVHFGRQVDLSGIDAGVPGAAQRATDRIIDAITEELRPLRVDEPRLPRYIDPVRPLSVQRRHRPSA
jgi:1-acyl-sn-glycerol-3-phosphate acyltransferase